MVGLLTLLVLATAAFSGGVVLVRSRRPAQPDGLDRDQLNGFLGVGAIALAVLGLGVAGLGWLADRPGPAEAMAVIGLMGYLIYLGVAGMIMLRTAARSGGPTARRR